MVIAIKKILKKYQIYNSSTFFLFDLHHYHIMEIVNILHIKRTFFSSPNFCLIITFILSLVFASKYYFYMHFFHGLFLICSCCESPCDFEKSNVLTLKNFTTLPGMKRFTTIYSSVDIFIKSSLWKNYSSLLLCLYHSRR